MKVLICYYSGSGNTKLACEKIVKSIQNADFALYNIVTETNVEIEKYDVVGFACFTDFGGVPFLMQNFIEKLTRQKSYAFVFNTYGFIAGRVLLDLFNLVKSKGFKMMGGLSFHTPENYPPMIVRGLPNTKAPNRRELKKFENFITYLDQTFYAIENNKNIEEKKVSIGLLSKIIPRSARTKARKDMGQKYVDLTLCTKCGSCQKGCPYVAINLNPFPEFDMNKCYGCWYCYNHCTKQAIYTNKYRGKGHYPSPLPVLKEKLS